METLLNRHLACIQCSHLLVLPAGKHNSRPSLMPAVNALRPGHQLAHSSCRPGTAMWQTMDGSLGCDLSTDVPLVRSELQLRSSRTPVLASAAAWAGTLTMQLGSFGNSHSRKVFPFLSREHNSLADVAEPNTVVDPIEQPPLVPSKERKLLVALETRVGAVRGLKKRRPAPWRSQLDTGKWHVEKARGVFMAEEVAGMKGSSSVIGKMMSEAITVFVKSQLEGCDDLKIRVAGGNRELLGGNVRQVAVSARSASYKGLTMTSVDLAASGISLGFGWNLKKRFLSEAFPARVCIALSNDDLNASLGSPFVQAALRDLFSLTPQQPIPTIQVTMQDGVLDITSLGPRATMPNFLPASIEVGLGSNGRHLSVRPVANRCLRAPLGWRDDGEDLIPKEIDLGPGTKITHLDITPKGVILVGNFRVTP